jgi:phosphatidylinositol alpha-1,6-mannosyltransferase
MVFVEAAACGKPSLAGIAGGTASAVLHEQTGLRVDGTSLDAVCKGLHQLLTDDALRQRLGIAGLTRVKTAFSWEAVTLKTRGLEA